LNIYINTHFLCKLTKTCRPTKKILLTFFKTETKPIDLQKNPIDLQNLSTYKKILSTYKTCRITKKSCRPTKLAGLQKNPVDLSFSTCRPLSGKMHSKCPFMNITYIYIQIPVYLSFSTCQQLFKQQATFRKVIFFHQEIYPFLFIKNHHYSLQLFINDYNSLFTINTS